MCVSQVSVNVFSNCLYKHKSKDQLCCTVSTLGHWLLNVVIVTYNLVFYLCCTL